MYSVLKDHDQGMAALIDPDAGVALGPVIHVPDNADQAETILEGFVGALGADPSTFMPWTLAAHFEQFVSALGPGEDGVPPAVAAAGDTAAPAGETAAPPGDDPAAPPAIQPPADPATPAPDVPIEPTAPTDEPPPPAPADTDQAGTPTGETAAPGPCPNCDGFGTVAQDGQAVTCPACNGTGQASTAAPTA